MLPRYATSLLGVIVTAFFLSGCATPELRQEKAVDDSLDFSALKKTDAEQKGASIEAPRSPKPAETKPVTQKKMYSSPPVMSLDTTKQYAATIVTSAGEMTVALNVKETPITVNNFVFLAREKFYDGTIFHRTLPGFMIQGGDPEGTGMGGPGYQFHDEQFSGKYDRGTLAMANAGPNTNGSQFFIMHKDYPLPPSYVIFGKVTKGLDVIDTIVTAPTKPGGEGSSPVTPVMIQSVTISEQ